jgi:uncharacterized protein (TIGR02284 family)
MQDLNNGIIDQLNHLLTITNDAKNGYALAAEKEEDSAIKKSFEHFGAEHAVYSNELKELVINLGGKVADVFAPGDVTNRSWMEVGAVAGDENKEPVINACINGEKALIKAYQKMLQDEQVDENVKKVLFRHLNAFEYTVRKITAHLTPTM